MSLRTTAGVIMPAEYASDLQKLADFWHAQARGEEPTAESSEQVVPRDAEGVRIEVVVPA